eukprot:GHVU01035870.1.p3 GENE.GHVU01035870.1~~GHVU01035870.1.p3  ORF type:complete len:119 (-),score=31.90 GHVU01035870.1:8-364(-)
MEDLSGSHPLLGGLHRHLRGERPFLLFGLDRSQPDTGAGARVGLPRGGRGGGEGKEEKKKEEEEEEEKEEEEEHCHTHTHTHTRRHVGETSGVPVGGVYACVIVSGMRDFLGFSFGVW